MRLFIPLPLLMIILLCAIAGLIYFGTLYIVGTPHLTMKGSQSWGGPEIIEKTFELPKCRYVVIELRLHAGDRVVVEWSSDVKYTYVGIGSKDELSSFRGSMFCSSATWSFYMTFEKAGSGYTGRLEWSAPTTGTFYVVVFHGWYWGFENVIANVHVTVQIYRSGR